MNNYLLYPLTNFAATYNCDAYGSGTYNEAGECVASTESGTTTGGSLVDTGSPYFVPLVIGAVLVLAALAIVVTKLVRRGKHAAPKI